MEDRRDAWLGLGRRLLLAVPLLAIGALLLAAPAGCPVTTERRILGLLCIVAACMVVAPALAALAAEPAGGLFHPRHFSPPQPGYSRAEAQRRRGWYAAALEEYERIAAQFPSEAHPYAAMMEIAAVDLRDTARLDAIARRALAGLADDAGRAQIVRLHRALSARLRAPAPHVDRPPSDP